MQDERNYWFPAKRYGWGWGFPQAWQGWAVLVAFVVLLVGGNTWLRHTVYAAPFSIALIVLLLLVCWLKGEPPSWRWGGD